MKPMRWVSLLVVALTLVRGADAQDPTSDAVTASKIRQAETAATRWLALVDSGRYAASWDAAAAVFRTQITQAQWQAAATAAREQVNPLGVRRRLNAQYALELPDAPPGEYVVIQYSTPARDNVRVVETLALMLETPGTWRVIGYFIRPE
jgi:hypothetical protein